MRTKEITMPRTLSRVQRRAAFTEMAVRAFDRMEEWYDEHPDASFGEIEAEARRERRELMGQALAMLINGRDMGHRLEAPKCPRCRQAMEFEGYRPWKVSGLEGDTELMRAYYVCPRCKGETFFPPRPQTGAASGPLE
jgi:phage FluMu protein Com